MATEHKLIPGAVYGAFSERLQRMTHWHFEDDSTTKRLIMLATLAGFFNTSDVPCFLQRIQEQVLNHLDPLSPDALPEFGNMILDFGPFMVKYASGNGTVEHPYRLYLVLLAGPHNFTTTASKGAAEWFARACDTNVVLHPVFGMVNPQDAVHPTFVRGNRTLAVAKLLTALRTLEQGSREAAAEQLPHLEGMLHALLVTPRGGSLVRDVVDALAEQGITVSATPCGEKGTTITLTLVNKAEFSFTPEPKELSNVLTLF